MKQIWKKLLVLVLALSMLASIAVPGVSAAEDNTTATTTDGEYVFPEYSDPVYLGEILRGELSVNEYATIYNFEGKDYLLVPAKGANLFVFKLTDYLNGDKTGSTWIHDQESTGINIARCIVGDGNGKFYICGDANYVYCYDFLVGSGYKIRIPSQRGATQGLVFDDAGYLYVTSTPDATTLPATIVKIDVFNDNKATVLYETKDVKSFGPLVVGDGYIYSCGVNRSKPGSVIHKVDLSTGALAGTYEFRSTNGLYYLSYIDGVIFGGHSVEVEAGCVAVDAETMTGIDVGIDTWIMGVATDPTPEGKSYLMCRGKGVYEYDVATRKATMAPGLIAMNINNRIRNAYLENVNHGSIKGKAIITVANSAAMPYLMSLEGQGFMTLDDMVAEAAAPAATRSIVSGVPGVTCYRKYSDGTVDEEGAEVAVYIGGYLCGRIGSYSPDLPEEKRINGNVVSVNNAQTDDMIIYKGKLYGGTYTGAKLIEYDPATDTMTELLTGQLYDKHGQLRLHDLAAGDDKIFFATLPENGKLGGSLGWYDLKTGEYKCYPHIVRNQSIIGLAYDEERDLLFACSSCTGGSGAIMTETEAMLVVYDVANDKHLGNFSIRAGVNPNSDMVFDFENGDVMPEYIAGIGRDPDTGKLWGLVCNTLFSFEYDVASNTMSVHEEWSGGDGDKSSYPHGASLYWFGRPFCFDGKGNLILNTYDAMRRFSTADPSDNTLILDQGSRLYAIGTDGNIYYTAGEYLYQIATGRISIVKAMIDGAKPADRDKIKDARRAYDSLTEEEKAEVGESYLNKLIALEGASQIFLEVAVENMIETIDSISAVTSAISSYAEIKAARNMYDNLYDDEKPLISNYDKLVAFEAAYAEISAKTQWTDPASVSYSFEPDDNPGVAGKLLQEVTFDQTADNLWAYACGCDPEHVGKFNAGSYIQVCFGDDGTYYLGVRVKIPSAGMYDITVRTKDQISGSLGAVYMFPDDGTPIVQLYQAISDEVTLCTGNTEHYVGSVDFKKAGNQNAGKWECQEAGEYILALGALYHPENLGYGDIYGVDMTYTNPVVDSAVAQAKVEIDAIGTVTEKSEAAIKKARDTYNSLTDAQKELIYAPQLEEAEKAYETCLADAEVVAEVEQKIEAIGEVTVDSGSAIEAARQAYDALESRQQKKVSNYKVLQKAERDYAKLTGADEDTDDGNDGNDGNNGNNGMTTVIIVVAAVLVVAAVVVAVILLGKKKKSAEKEEAPTTEDTSN